MYTGLSFRCRKEIMIIFFDCFPSNSSVNWCCESVNDLYYVAFADLIDQKFGNIYDKKQRHEIIPQKLLNTQRETILQ